MKRVGSVLGLLVVLVSGVAADEVGSVTYLTGYPEVVRDGRTLTQEIDFGFRVESFDSITTDATSSLEIEFDPATGIDASVSVEPDTTFAIDVTSLRSEQTGAIELAAGSVSVTARRLMGTSRFEIRTPSAAMGVRGTVFSVTGSADGAVLVSTDEGLVEVTDDTGRTLFASPGEAVEVDEEAQLFRSLKYDRSRLADFRRTWRAERAERFVENAPRILAFYGRRYQQVRTEFIDAYAELMTYRDTIDEWMDEGARGVRPSRDELRDMRGIIPTVLRVRMALHRFEPVMARLDQMAPFVREFAADVEIEPGFTAADLYRTVNNDRRIMRERIATVRHIFKLAAERNGGELPFDLRSRPGR